EPLLWSNAFLESQEYRRPIRHRFHRHALRHKVSVTPDPHAAAAPDLNLVRDHQPLRLALRLSTGIELIDHLKDLPLKSRVREHLPKSIQSIRRLKHPDPKLLSNPEYLLHLHIIRDCVRHRCNYNSSIAQMQQLFYRM